MTSKKYTVKGCPAITEKGRCKLGYEPEYGCFCEYVYDDCKIKQIVERTQRYYDEFCGLCGTKNCSGCSFDLAQDILQLLDVQEVG